MIAEAGHSDLGDMCGLLQDVFLVFNLPPQAVKVLVHLILVVNHVLPLAFLEGLDLRVDTGGQRVLIGLVGLLALTLASTCLSRKNLVSISFFSLSAAL